MPKYVYTNLQIVKDAIFNIQGLQAYQIDAFADIIEIAERVIVGKENLQNILYKFECYHKRTGTTDNLRSILIYTIGDNTDTFIVNLVCELREWLING